MRTSLRQCPQDIPADLSRANGELWRATGGGAGSWLGKAEGLGLVLSDGCCCTGLQVLRVKSILLPRTETVLDTIWSCSKSKVFTEKKIITGNNMNA